MLSQSIPSVEETSNTKSSVDINNDPKSNKCIQILRTRPLLCCAIYFALAYFIQGITDIASGFVNLPLQTILKDSLHLTPSQMGKFFFTCTITWSIKPIYGLISDFLPICGYHRLLYLLVTTIINLLAWIALYFGPIDYKYLLIFCVLAAFSLAFNDVLIDALMISVGRPLALIGTFQGIQQTAAKFASTVSQIPAGILASSSLSFDNLTTTNPNHTSTTIIESKNKNKYIFLISSICPIILFCATLIAVRERRRKLNKNNFQQTWLSLSNIFFYKHSWLIACFLFIYSASPQMKTALFYYQRDILKFSPYYVSILNTIYNGCGAFSALLYLSIFSHYPTQSVLRTAIVMRMFAIVCYIFALDRWTSIGVAIFTGLCSEITNLALLNLAARSCPKNIEGTLFALFVSCVNFGTATGDWLGSYLYEHMGFITLILTSVVWVGMTIFATCHIGDYAIQSTLEKQHDIEDKYHYYDVIVQESVTLEINPGEENDDDDDTNEQTIDKIKILI